MNAIAIARGKTEGHAFRENRPSAGCRNSMRTALRGSRMALANQV